jgi:hypothetical protein
MRNGDVWQALQFEPMAPARCWERFLAGDRSVSPLQVLALIVLEDFVVRHGLSV